MGMVFGYAAATPTLLSVLQACKEKTAYAEWVPTFFNKAQGALIAQMVDIMLPKTDTPAATEVNVHVFIDAFSNEVLPVEQQLFMKMTMETFFKKLQMQTGKENLLSLKVKDLEPHLAKYLTKRTDQEEEAQEKAIEDYMKATLAGDNVTLDEETACYSFATSLRNTAIWAYKNSEYIGEEVLAYLPIPGEYIGCGDVNSLSGGKAWSL